MAPRTSSKSKSHKAKGEKKKKEDKLLPTILDVLVNLPNGDEIILKGISTDRILDVRKLLAVNVDTCHLTRFSLSHQVRGDRLSDSQELVHLKPCVLTLVEEAYTEELAIDHVRRLLDLVSCITCFGPSGKLSADKETEGKTGENSISLKDIKDITKLCPPSELGKFYEFFSFAHLKSPFLSIKLSQQACSKGDLFSLEVKLASGKHLSVTACSTGFYHTGKQQVKSHALVDLLRHLSKSFNDNYEELLRAFGERNKFANIPYGLRANTWVVPPVAADSPSAFPSLPAEDETWGGNGGGQGRKAESLDIPWSRHFSSIADMPCETSEEREVRDHKAFVLHNYFVDVATTNAVAVARELDSSGSFHMEHVEIRGTLKFSVTRDATDPSRKVFWKIEARPAAEIQKGVSERNLLKGIMADESTVVHDTCTLGVVLVRYKGYKVAVEVVPSEQSQDILDIIDPPEGGANALNANSLRILLHRNSPRQDASVEEEDCAKDLFQKRIEEATASGSDSQSQYFRWELGACWVQHLGETTKANTSDKADKTAQQQSKEEPEEASPLKGLVSDSSLERLRGTKSGLHLKSVSELMKEAELYYNNVALPKLVSDFSALELSPVEGRTLTDFMHIRGLRIASLGHLADLCSKLPHIRSLCIHEMIIRAFKHLLRAVIASVRETSELALAIATTLNSIFSSLPTEGKEEPVDRRVWKWLESFVLARFRWKLAYDSRLNLRKYALLRGICYKVGIEMAPRNYDFSRSTIFSKADILSLVPVYKHAICSSADGRTLLESSKAALDKGKLEEAVTFGSKALTKLIAVCGPYHRMTAGAYSLLAVVLYHTGDFNQAMIYQQKALDINERELGLDHPDTMKSYGDLAVFYYRLQHTELALRYVNRALYLLHLICGPSHPNTAATYINVAMMEEALGNAHVALRYLHEALKCNERLLGKDHIQTAASYHAIAIALSLMEAYTLSVHHEQTTYQILQAKLGPDDIRTQDAAAWLDYFDSKAVEQQEAARTGAPKPDPSVASKGHLSVSDLLDFINTEVSRSNDKGTKKPKRLKVLAMDEVGDFLAQEPATAEAEQSQNQIKNPDGPAFTVESKVEEKSGEILHTEVSPPPPEPELKPTPTLSDVHSDNLDSDEGWLEASSKGKHHRKLLQRRRSFAGSQASTSFRINVQPASPVGKGIQEKQEVQEKQEGSSNVAEVHHIVAKLGRSYKDVALTPARTEAKIDQERKTEAKAVGEAEDEDSVSCEASSNCSSASLSAAARPYSPNAVAMTAAKANLVKASSGMGRPDHLQQTTVAVAVTPIRKQVHTPSKIPVQVCQAHVIPPPPPSPPTTQPAQASPVAPGSPSHLLSPATPGKKLMNPFATEFVPGRKWHPFVSSETNTFQAGGSSKEEGQEKQSQGGDGGVSNGAAPEAEQAETVPTPVTSMEYEEQTEQEALDIATEMAGEEKTQGPVEEAIATEHEATSFASTITVATAALDQREQDHSGDDRLSTDLQMAAMTMKRWSSSSSSNSSSYRSRTRARWQRRSDGAITRVYRLQGGNSSANPQLKTTSTFSDVPEPHTLQSPASSTLMRRSVQVS